MQINKIEPQGFCGGVKRAIEIVNDLIEDSSVTKPIYMLGSLIHNNHIINTFKEKGIIILDDKLSKDEMIDQVSSGTVIISAHGISPRVLSKAKNKGLNIIDTTCPYVALIHDKITSSIKDKKEIIYIGMPNHPEVSGVLGINDNIHLVSNIDDINKLNLKNDNPYVTNQTTLSIYDINHYYELIKTKYPNAIIDNKICNATTIRQEAVAKQEKVDLCIIVGDKKSSNANRLVEVARSAGADSALVETVDDLKNMSFPNTVAITAAASAPEEIVQEIVDYLKSF